MNESDRTRKPFPPGGHLTWYVDAAGIEKVVIRGPVEFESGSKTATDGLEQTRKCKLEGSYALALKQIPKRNTARSILLESVVDFDRQCNQAHECVSTLKSVNTEEGEEDQYLSQVSYDFGKGGYRLPRATEWEYAARAETKTVNYFGSELTRKAIFPEDERTREKSVDLASLPNSYGLVGTVGALSDLTCSQVHPNRKREVPIILDNSKVVELRFNTAFYSCGDRSCVARVVTQQELRINLGLRLCQSLFDN